MKPELEDMPAMGKPKNIYYERQKARDRAYEAVSGLNDLRLVSPARMRAQQAALSHIAEYDLKDTPETREILIHEFMECEL